ncbi:MAG: KpsF/GutQ family sugar-phosphate isomerase [Holosporaceae bacterium]|jgi:arabinose-5-phosphate isomerase|nr:KpsF/GutQ family sugar-phosphate isomerase [Holosporaceae bacterium]
MQKNNELDYARSVFAKEIDGLERMSDSLSDSFICAVDLIYGKNGHLIVSGIGKAGHIGRKISATMASTGTPSFFMHPAEASHGDLGVISMDDVLLMLSFSGNTQELVPVLDYVNRFGIDVVSITADCNSILAKSSKIVIEMPKFQEACPHNLAPTTSTTVMAAVGDALALCLLERKHFNRDDFKKLHPGGALGRRLLLVKDLMHTNFPLVEEDSVMQDVLREMSEKSFGCAFVIDGDGRISGIITDGDLRRGIVHNFLELRACDIMTRHPRIISPNAFAQEATKIMNKRKITSLIVSEEDLLPCGIIHIHDCLRAGLA